MLEDIKSNLGGVDVVFANAGVGHFGNLEDLTIEQYDESFNVNVRGVFLWLNKTLPMLKSQNHTLRRPRSKSFIAPTYGQASYHHTHLAR